jgi:hypothetical protein
MMIGQRQHEGVGVKGSQNLAIWLSDYLVITIFSDSNDQMTNG